MSPKLQLCFLLKLKQALDFLQRRDNLQVLIKRNGEFDKALVDGRRQVFTDAIVNQYIGSWIRYLNIQTLPEVYGDLLAALPATPLQQQPVASFNPKAHGAASSCV